MTKLLSPALLLLLLTLSGGFSEVVNNFTQTCPQFFATPGGAVSPPTVFTGNNYKQICQVRANTHEYATLYDTSNRIPVYSAYRFIGFMGCQRNDNWYIEPQLEDRKNGPRMDKDNNKTLQHQAVNSDYKGTKPNGYDKGHLAPVLHATSQGCADATFTLTNAAPQDRSFNRGQWKKTERDVADFLEKDCIGYSRYIVTGVVPDNNKPPLNNRVRIPSHYWMAYCCLDQNNRVKASGGFIGENRKTSVQNMSVAALEGRLTDLYNKIIDFHVFGGRCYQTSTPSRRFSSVRDLRLQQLRQGCRKQTLSGKRKCYEKYRKNYRAPAPEKEVLS